MKTTFIITAVVLLLSRGGLTKHSDFIQVSAQKARHPVSVLRMLISIIHVLAIEEV